jgi:hypothetical protein
LDIELRVATPFDWRVIGETEQSRYPEEILLASPATELRAELDVVEIMAQVSGVAFNLPQGAHLAGSDDLVLIEEKHGDPSSGDEFVEL